MGGVDTGVDNGHGDGGGIDRRTDGFEVELVERPLRVDVEGQDRRPPRFPVDPVGGIGRPERLDPLDPDRVPGADDGDPRPGRIGGQGGGRRGGHHHGGQGGEAGDDGAPKPRPPEGVDERHEWSPGACVRGPRSSAPLIVLSADS